MGALLEPTVEMGPWRVEVRDESWYLNGEDVFDEGDDPATVHAPHARVDGGLAFPEVDLPHVRAAVEQIVARPEFLRWLAEGGVEEQGAWSLLERRGGLIYLDGPLHAYGLEWDWAVRTVEVEYRHASALRALLSEIEQE